MFACADVPELVVSHLPRRVQLQFVSQEGGPLRYGEPGGVGAFQRTQQRPHLPREVREQAANLWFLLLLVVVFFFFSFFNFLHPKANCFLVILQHPEGAAVKIQVEDNLLPYGSSSTFKSVVCFKPVLSYKRLFVR